MKIVLFLISLLLFPALCAAQGASVPPDDRKAAAGGNNEFAVDLYGKLEGTSGNLFFSPASISTALAMTYAGARGETAVQMEKTLHFTLGQQRLHPAMAQLISDLNAEGAADGFQLSVANALWVQKDDKLLDFYSDTVKNRYGAGLGELDFKTHAQIARTIINEWVSDKTEHKINDLIPDGAITRDTRLILTDAVYFKAGWEKIFKKSATKDGEFQTADKQSVNVPLMHITSGFNYMRGGNFQGLELPYKNRDLSMLIFLPDKPKEFAAFEKNMNAQHLNRWLDEFKLTPKVEVTLPKFKLDQSFALADTLKEMGMASAFDPKAADFSAMIGKKELYISAVLHKAFVEVDEEGTEAAAATAVMVATLSAAVNTPPPVIFNADHPFLFIIRDNRSGSFLFMGRVSDPTK